MKAGENLLPVKSLLFMLSVSVIGSVGYSAAAWFTIRRLLFPLGGCQFTLGDRQFASYSVFDLAVEII